MPDPRIPIVAGVLRNTERENFVAPKIDDVARRVVEALDRATPGPAADQVEIVARAIREAFGAVGNIIPHEDGEGSGIDIWHIATKAITALSVAPRVREISDAMVERAAKVWVQAAGKFDDDLAPMRAALSAALAGRDREVADAREIELRKAYAGLRIAWPEVHGDELDRMDAAVDAFSRLAPSPSVTAPPPAESVSGWQATHQHVKGGLYRLIMQGEIEADLTPCVIYDDQLGRVWVRPREEFARRFAPLPTVEPGGGG